MKNILKALGITIGILVGLFLWAHIPTMIAIKIVDYYDWGFFECIVIAGSLMLGVIIFISALCSLNYKE